MFANKIQTIVDEVRYSNLLIGREYTVKGILMDKDTGKPLLVDGKEVHQTKKFIATKRDGKINLDFTFNAEGLDGKTLVVFEDLFRDSKQVATHSEIDDIEQTVKLAKIGDRKSTRLNSSH